MAEDWDLYAVVRGCRSATAAAESSSAAATSSNTTSSQDVSLPYKEENDPFSFPSLIQPRTNEFQELHQLFIPFIPTTTTNSGCGIYTNSSFPDFAGAGSSNTALPATSSYASNTRPHFMPQASATSGFERFHDQHVQQPQQQQQQQQQQKQIQNQLQLVQQQQFQIPGQISSSNNSAMTLPNTQAAQTPRSRKRKSQQKRMVCHVTAENLNADLWAWRKYGQKPIKGSPYPRNYYRCSSSKGCAARKQVERSNTEPDMFIVTYTGDHTHPRPTHRNSLAGSTRNKPSTTRQPTSHESGSPSNTANRASSSSPLSPTTPLTEAAANDECADDPMLSNESTSPFPDNDELNMASDDDILIPNMAAMMENIFLGAHQFEGGSGSTGGGGDSASDNPADGSHPNIQPGLTPAPQNNFSHPSWSSPG